MRASKLVVVVGEHLLDAAQHQFDSEIEDPVDRGGDCEGHHTHLRGNKGLGGGEHLAHANGKCQGRVLHQRDDLVANRRHDALDHLWQHDVEEGLRLGIPQDLGGLILAAGDGLQAAAINLGEIRGIVDDERDDGRLPLGVCGELNAEQDVYKRQALSLGTTMMSPA